jgi:hypothetical protein
VIDDVVIALEQRHEVVAVGAKLDLEVAVAVPEEEGLHHFVIPQAPEGPGSRGLVGMGPGGRKGVVKIRCPYQKF